MRKFDYTKTAHQIIDDEIVSLLTKIYELKGMHNYILKYTDTDFGNMKRFARINSLIHTLKIEDREIPLKDIEFMFNNNIVADDSNAHKLFYGCNEALNYIFSDKSFGLKSDLILEILRKTKANTNLGIIEYRKDKDRIINLFKPDRYYIRFKYNSASGGDIQTYIENICSEFKYSVAAKNTEPLIASTIFMADYLAIFPFYQNNRKMFFLLFDYMLKLCDFKIAEYISVEKIISENIETFYKAWEHTMINWNEGKNDYKEMTAFLLKVVLQAYKAFSDFIELYNSDMTKPERIEYILKDSGFILTKRELMELSPDISETTIEITLGELLREGKIEKIGGGRYTKYIYKYHYTR